MYSYAIMNNKNGSVPRFLGYVTVTGMVVINSTHKIEMRVLILPHSN